MRTIGKPGHYGASYIPDRAIPLLHFIICGGSILFASTRATLQVYLLHHNIRDEWLLPKGPKDRGEDITATAVRETFEETGYPCWQLPLDLIKRRAPEAGAQTKDAAVLGGEVKVIWSFATVRTGEERMEGTPQTEVESFESTFFGVNAALEKGTFQTDRDVIAKAVEIVRVTYPEAVEKLTWTRASVVKGGGREGDGEYSVNLEMGWETAPPAGISMVFCEVFPTRTVIDRKAFSSTLLGASAAMAHQAQLDFLKRRGDQWLKSRSTRVSWSIYDYWKMAFIDQLVYPTLPVHLCLIPATISATANTIHVHSPPSPHLPPPNHLSSLLSHVYSHHIFAAATTSTAACTSPTAISSSHAYLTDSLYRRWPGQATFHWSNSRGAAPTASRRSNRSFQSDSWSSMRVLLVDARSSGLDDWPHIGTNCNLLLMHK
ncbi:hypothetical protein EI94DRAFT_1706488 [Lactarius quietus]|nr:hypothetical protein EI94DRAFT_1706488 [Lactarius quietus]